MKIITTVALLSLTLTFSQAQAAKNSESFEMKVDKVTLLKGFILKGLALEATVKQGCIASHDIYQVYRDGKKVYETNTQILDVEGQEAYEAKAGDHTNFYAPDAKEGQIIAGDILKSSVTHCKAAAESPQPAKAAKS
ncbi:hypothetical protein [Teredinibacter turnerae]|uniref:Lipoprotein n=1 Tax=Teredinibacter turnerae (strain ATCC 39867 / T7901) TaxID=377629 RepID=C5BM38_TERTT|nr:hypothetical protein [Teredinibacter turnerae]ACR12013.1 hypothetical protein TERTU_0290 [Teredinibacter turnerae T7901]